MEEPNNIITAQEQIVLEVIEQGGLVENERIGIALFHGHGDFYAIYASIRNAEKRSGKELVVICPAGSRVEMAGWFSAGEEPINLLVLDNQKWLKLLNCRNNRHLCEKYKDILIMSYKVNQLVTYIHWTGSNFPRKQYTKPHFPEFHDAFYIERYQVVPGQTIWIFPEANCVQPLPDYFWNTAAYFYELMGFRVLFNVSDANKHKFRGAQAYIPIRDVVHFADLCGHVLGVRSGMLDIIMSVSTAHIIAYSARPPFSAPVMNEVFENPNKQIRTIYYEPNDYWFTETEPLKDIAEYFGAKEKPWKELASALAMEWKPMQNVQEKKYLIKQKLYRPHPWGRFETKLADERKTNEETEFTIRYGKSDKYIYVLWEDLRFPEYHIDIFVYKNNVEFCVYEDVESNVINCVVDGKGRYKARIRIVRKADYLYAIFDTEEIVWE